MSPAVAADLLQRCRTSLYLAVADNRTHHTDLLVGVDTSKGEGVGSSTSDRTTASGERPDRRRTWAARICTMKVAVVGREKIKESGVAETGGDRVHEVRGCGFDKG